MQIEAIVDVREFIRKMHRETKALTQTVHYLHEQQQVKAEQQHVETASEVKRIHQNIDALISRIDDALPQDDDDEARLSFFWGSALLTVKSDYTKTQS